MNRPLLVAALVSPGLLGLACGDDSVGARAETIAEGGAASSGSSGAVTSGGSTGSTSGGPVGPGCHQLPQPDDATRFVVAARPYAAADAGTDMAHRYTTFSLTAAGAVSILGDFELGGYSSAGRIAFTPDGRVGAVPLESRTQEDRGGVGVFRLDDAGNVTVIHANYKGDFFSSDAAFSPDGNTLYVTEAGAPQHGGGLYAISVACDGSLGEARRITEGTGTTVPSWAPAGTAAPWRALVAADALAGAPEGHGLHLFAFDGATTTRVASVDAFGEQTLIRDMAWTPDGTHALMTAPHPDLGGMRVLAASVASDALAVADEWELDGAETVVASPYGNAFFVGTADPDGAFVLHGSAGTFTAPAPVTLVSPTPQLPFAAHVIDRGALKGRIVMAELLGIRQLQFDSSGAVTDVSLFVVPSGGPGDFTAIVGAMGVTP